MPRTAGVFAPLMVMSLMGVVLAYKPWSCDARRPGVASPEEVAQAAEEQADPPRQAAKAPQGYAVDWDVKAEPIAFDAKRAMGYLEELCKIGPRMSGTEGMKKQQELIEKHFKAQGGKITWQKFRAKQASVREPVEMANLIVSWKPELPRRVILCSHYDTRPIADRDPTPRNRNRPMISANDGGSGVALLMELAHHMNKLDPKVGVDFVLFDGEEYIFDTNRDEYFFGSKHFAAEYRKARKQNDEVYLAAVLLDMIGGKDLRIPMEQNSWDKAPALIRDVYKVAAQQKCAAFKSNELSKFAVEDDHIPLNNAGIPAIDLIDFDYRHWHCLSDLPENCSGESMGQVARVLSVWLQRLK